MIFDKEKHDKLDCGEYADYDPEFKDSLYGSIGLALGGALAALCFVLLLAYIAERL